MLVDFCYIALYMVLYYTEVVTEGKEFTYVAHPRV